MPSSSEEEFEDPQLKGALKRMLGSGRAPISLRQRISSMLVGATATLLPTDPEPVTTAENTVVDSAATSSSRLQTSIASRRASVWNRPLGMRSLMTAAAVVILGTSLATYYTFTETGWGSDRTFARVHGPAITDALIQDIVTRHDEALANSSAKLKIPASPGADLAQLRLTLAQRINRPVWVADLRTDGWEFRGASVCDVSGQETAQVFFTKGAAAVSLMSMPAPDVCHGNLIDDYDQWVNNHAVYAFSARGQLFCMVGSSRSGELAKADVEKLMSKFKADALAMLNEPRPAVASIDK